MDALLLPRDEGDMILRMYRREHDMIFNDHVGSMMGVKVSLVHI